MCLIELDEFDFWVDEGVVNDIYKFSPIFIHIVGWAYEEGFINERFFDIKMLDERYNRLLIKDITFQEFVDEVLEGKLVEAMFKDSVREFLVDYIELSRYSKDISKYFRKSMWDFPQEPSCFKEVYSIISKSKCNYDKHKLNHPELAIFEDDYDFD